MSTFACPVVRVASVEDHPNADRLNIVRLEGLGYICISGKLEDGTPRYKAGDWVVYIPSAAVLPEWLLKEMDFWNDETGKGTLAGANGDRVKPLKLRGVFSEGVLYSVDNDGYFKVMDDTDGEGHYTCIPICVEVGDDVAGLLGITKWEPPIPVHMAGEVASVAEAALKYDFERWESVPDIFAPDELVVATEKLHGTCCIIQYFPGMDHPEMFPDHAGYRSITVSSKGRGSQGLVFKNNEANANNLYVQALRTLLDEYDLAARMHSMSKVDGGTHPVAILGEIFGKGVQDLHYGSTKPMFRMFDMRIGNTWQCNDSLTYWSLEIPRVPVLYRGPFDLAAIEAVRDGKTATSGDNIREGVVVTSMIPGDHPLHGRKICKMISPDYLLRKVKGGGEATEYN